MTNNQIKALSRVQRKAYKTKCLELFCNGFHGDLSLEAYNQVVSMTEGEMREYINTYDKTEKKPTNAELIKAIRARYSREELEELASGTYQQSNVHKVCAVKQHHKIAVISDTHIGSIYTPDEWIQYALKTIEDSGCECILHCGDLTEGMKGSRLREQIYEIKKDALGYRDMRDYAVNMFKDCKVPTYIISGNHDKFFQDNADIVEDVCGRLHNMTYLGYNHADIMVGNCKIHLFHGTDGHSSVRLAKVAESSNLEKNGIKMLFAGHVHKFEVKYIHGAYCVHVPSLQAQSTWMNTKKLIADCGFLIVEFDEADGKIDNVTIQYYPL